LGLLTRLRSLIVTDPVICQRVRIVALRDEVPKLVEELHRLGAFEVSEPRLAGERELRAIEEKARLIERASRVVTEYLRRLPSDTIVRLSYLPTLEELEKLVPKYVKELEEDVAEIRRLEEEIDEVEERLLEIDLLIAYLEQVRDSLRGIDVSDLFYEGRVLATTTLVGSERGWRGFLEAVGDRLTVVARAVVGENVVGTVAYMRVFEREIRDAMELAGLREIRVRIAGGVDEAIERLREMLGERARLEELRERVLRIVERNLEKVAAVKMFIENEEDRLQILRLGIATRYVFVVEGWVPATAIEELQRIVRERTESGVMELVETDEQPPVVMRNPRPLKPFELIPTFFGYPSPGEWDPTPIMAYSFIFFFSFIVGDAGYAIGIALATRFILPKFVENPESESFKALQRILYVCAAGAAVFGLLTGCFFGPHPTGSFWWWLRAISRTPELPSKIMPILMVLSMWTGYVHMVIAHSLAAAKNRKMRDLWGMINEIGIVLLMIFGGIYIASWLSLLPIPSSFAHTVCLPIAVAALGMIVASKIKSSGGLGALLWIFDVTGPLSDVISYVRLAALDMATLLMAYVFNTAAMGIISSFGHAGILSFVVGIAMGAFVLVMGHIFNIALGALGAFVHSLRLCILEFGTKFYEGMGRPLRPAKIRLSKYVVLGRA